MTRRKEVIRILEGICRLSFWALLLTLGYGILLWIIEYLNKETIPLHIKMIICSFCILVLSLFFIFAVDDEEGPYA